MIERKARAFLPTARKALLPLWSGESPRRRAGDHGEARCLIADSRTGNIYAPRAASRTQAFVSAWIARGTSAASTVLGHVLSEDSMSTYKVGYFVGSLATQSINRQLARALVRLAPPELAMTEIPFRDLPLYSYDYDADYPPAAKAFKSAIAAVDAVVFVTPEYNRSIPGGLKNAIDWASRPYGKNSFSRKPSAIIGTSIGAIGTAIAQTHLRGVLSFCNSPLMNAPEAYIQWKAGLVDGDGNVTVQSTQDFLRTWMRELHAFIVRVYTVLPRGV